METRLARLSPGRAPVALLSAALALGGLVAIPAAVAAGQTFVVDSTGNAGDAAIDGVCDTAPGAPVECTLRAAIEEANATGTSDRIEFQVGGPGATGVRTIRVGFIVLPAITSPLVIDGYSQPTASPNSAATGSNAILRVVLDGPCSEFTCQPAQAFGLDVRSSGVTVRGLAIGDFHHAIRVAAGSAVIAGNFIGTDARGLSPRPNQGSGVVVAARGAQVGGTAAADRNIISGNEGSGILLQPGALEAVVQGNLVGTDRSGVGDLGNGGAGIELRGTGFGKPGQGPLIGGGSAAAANVVAWNGGAGVRLDRAVPNQYADYTRILRNSVFSNARLGIDLLPLAGRTFNDFNDGDFGANGLQNYPVIASARTSATQTTIKGTLNSTPNAEFLLQFFSNPDGSEEARVFLGQKKVTNSITGYVDFTFVPARKVPVGSTVTATATDVEYQQTSELSVPKTVRSE